MIGETSSNVSNDTAIIDEFYVKVIDYDGTIIDEQYMHNREIYTLPNPPSHSGLIFQEWNASTNIINNQIIINNNNVIIGAVYTTVSGKNEFDIELTVPTGLVVNLNMDGIKDWGDGTTDTNTSHTYTDYGEYTIKCDGTTITASSSSGIFNQKTGTSYINYYVKNIRLVNTTNITNYAFQYCYSLTNVILSNNITNINSYAFQYCYSLKHITIPRSVTSIGTYIFQHCHALSSVVLSNGLSALTQYMFYYCYSLYNIVIPDSITSIDGCFYYCYALNDMIVPDNVTNFSRTFSSCYTLSKLKLSKNILKIGSYAFYRNYCLKKVDILSDVFYVDSYVFDTCSSVLEYNFTECSSVPILANINAFNGINKICKIKVPFDLYSDWILATNWSTYADYIYGGEPAIINFNIISGNPDIYINNDIIENTTINWWGSRLIYSAYDINTNTLFPPTIKKGITEGSIQNIDIDLSNSSKISLNTGVSGLNVKFYINGIGFNAYDDNGNYYLNIVGNEVEIYYYIDGGNNYMDEDGTITTTGSDITENITMRSATVSTWVRPNLTSNGIIGGDSFAVSAEEASANRPAWKAVDGSTGAVNYWLSPVEPYYKNYIFYNPVPITVSQLSYYFTGSLYYAADIKVQACNDGINWLTISSTYTRTDTTKYIYTSTLNNNNIQYKYYKLIMRPAYMSSGIELYDLSITAIIKTEN